MKSTTVHPSTVGGIKRLAKTLKRDRKLPHRVALNEASKAAGFQNFEHAQHALPQASGTARYPLHITTYWRNQHGRSGRETLSLVTRTRWDVELRPQDVGRARGLAGFRFDATDHLEQRSRAADQRSARRDVCAAARDIDFMEASGLRPAAPGRSYAFQRAVGSLPHFDHGRIWVDPSTDEFVLTEEPYDSDPALDVARASWARLHLMSVVRCQWPGMHAPYMSTLYLVCRLEFDDELRNIARRVDALDPPFDDELMRDEWPGASASADPVFVTQGRRNSGKIKRALPSPPLAGQRRDSAIAFGSHPLAMRWKPDRRLPIDDHIEAGRLLKALFVHGRVPALVRHAANTTRSQLEDWLLAEYRLDELPQENFTEIYYGDAPDLTLFPLGMLARVIELLQDGYPDCAPRRALLRPLFNAKRRFD